MTVSPFTQVLRETSFTAYRDAYVRVRARYGWNDPPVIYQPGHTAYIPEPMPSKVPKEQRGQYFADTEALFKMYDRALALAEALGKKRQPKLPGYDGDVQELLVYNLQLQLDELRAVS